MNLHPSFPFFLPASSSHAFPLPLNFMASSLIVIVMCHIQRETQTHKHTHPYLLSPFSVACVHVCLGLTNWDEVTYRKTATELILYPNVSISVFILSISPFSSIGCVSGYSNLGYAVSSSNRFLCGTENED